MNNATELIKTDVDTCPAWCTEDDCRGEHWQSPDYYSGTGADPYVSPELGAVFPVVGVGLNHNVRCGDDGASLTLHITGYAPGGRHVDVNVFLRPSEAADVASALSTRVALLRRGGTRLTD